MNRKNLKLYLIIAITIITLFSFSFCYAQGITENANTANVTSTENSSETETTSDSTDTATETTTEDANYHSGDLFLCEKNLTFDKIVDGNVYIISDNVKITGQINGNLFIIANNITFEPSSTENTDDSSTKCYIASSVYALANTINFNAICTDLYAATSNLNVYYDACILRDINVVSSDSTIKAYIGRNANIFTNTLNLGTDKNDAAIINNNLNYTSAEETEILDGIVIGKINYTNYSNNTSTSLTANIISIIIPILNYIAIIYIVYVIIFKVLNPAVKEKIKDKNLYLNNFMEYLCYGIITICLLTIAIIFSIFTIFMYKLAFILIALFYILSIVAIPVFLIKVVKFIQNKFNIGLTYLLLPAIIVISYLIKLQPYIGSIFWCILSVISIGFVISLFKNEKMLTEEELREKEEKLQKKLEQKKLKKQEKENSSLN